MPLAIVRPSIVGCSAVEPVPGWVDCITAAGAVYVAVGLGVLKFLPGTAQTIADVVPVDYVVNAILAAIPAIAQRDKQHLILHACSSSERPMYWGDPLQYVTKYFLAHPAQRRLSDPSFKFIGSPQQYQIEFFLRYSVPSTLMNTLAPLATKSYQVKAAQFNKLVFRVRVIIESFRHFVENEWHFNNKNTRAVGAWLTDAERAIFPLSLATFDWATYNTHFAFGLMKYVLKSDLNEFDPTDTRRYTDLNMNHWQPLEKDATIADRMRTWFVDADWLSRTAKQRPHYPLPRTVADMRSVILAAPAVQQALRAEVSGSGGKLTSKVVEERARGIMDKMFADEHMPVIRGMGYAFRKIWRRIYDAIQVESSGLAKAKQAAQRGPLIFVPTHRSYIDFLIVSYICFACGLPVPHIAAGEDFLGILLVRWLFRRSGAFFIRRSLDSGGDALYAAIFQQYVQQLLRDGQSIEFFIEGTRSRSGKMLHPKLGLLSMLTDCVLDCSDAGNPAYQLPGAANARNATIIPITINYEKTIEGDLYSSELLGDNKIKESLKSLLRSSTILNINFGSISVRFNEPIPLAQYTQLITEKVQRMPPPVRTPMPHLEMPSKLPPLAEPKVESSRNSSGQTRAVAPNAASSTSSSASSGSEVADPSAARFDPVSNRAHRRPYNHLLAYSIVHSLTSGIEAMPTHLVATLLLMYRQGITRAQLVDKVAWLRMEIQMRGGKLLGLDGEDRSVLVDRAIMHLNPAVMQRRQHVYEPAISARHEYRNMLVLGHYRNKIVHHFFREGLWAAALYAFGEPAMEQGVDKTALLAEVRFLYALLHREVLYKASPEPDTDEELLQTLDSMVGRGILRVASGSGGRELVEVAASGESHFSFLCALLWPFIDSYYVAVLLLFSLQPARQIDEHTLLQRTQWLATTLYHESMLCFYESCSLDTLKNAHDTLRAWGVIAVDKPQQGNGKKTAAPAGSAAAAAAAASEGKSGKAMVRLLPPYDTEHKLNELMQRISRLRKQPPVRRNAVRRNLIADIPILAKL